MKNDELISVIIPIYKTEPYLRKCLDSVVSQTYKNLEIILVDDGSPDGCGAICDEYAAKDERITVIHKENGGVSSARNAGLEKANGVWIGWVDSDDYIESEMYEKLYRRAVETGSDISVCGRYVCTEDKREYFGRGKEDILSRDDALRLLLEDIELGSYLWDKLWRRELFDGIRFPEGRIYEDIAVMHRLFIRANSAATIPDALYYYIQRDESIVHDPSLSSRLTHYNATKNRCDELINDFPQLSTLLLAQCAASAVGIWGAYYHSAKSERKEYADEIKSISAFCRENYKQVMSCSRLGAAGKLVLRLTKSTSPFAFGISYIVSGIYKLRHGKRL